ncbi:PQ_loop repeat-containing protein [Hexamita inflata]|uniref:PQ_loop repeat-containing protein n=1 Tax=Hexamita inflata TaxID=28002 RepID=A0ABP1J9S8_9EUKA
MMIEEGIYFRDFKSDSVYLQSYNININRYVNWIKQMNLLLCKNSSKIFVYYKLYIYFISNMIDVCNKCQTATDFTCYLQTVDITTVIFGIVQILGSVISVLPQIIKLQQVKTTFGVSIFMLALATINNYSLTLSLIMNKFPQIISCSQNFSLCMKNLFSQLVSLILSVGFLTPYIQYLKFQVRDSTYKRNIVIFSIIIFLIIVSTIGIILSGIYYSVCNQVFQSFISVFSIISAKAACIQWLPQIFETYKSKSVGNLSITCQVIGVPGQLITLFLLISTNNGWITWVTCIVLLIVQSMLLFLLLKYKYCYKRHITRSQLIICQVE